MTRAIDAPTFADRLGGGLAVAALTDTCAMGAVLARLPWNRRGSGGAGSGLDRLVRKS